RYWPDTSAGSVPRSHSPAGQRDCPTGPPARFRLAAAYADPFTSDLVKSGRKSWAAIRDHLESKAKDERTISDVVMAALSQRVEEDEKALVELARPGNREDSGSQTRKREENERISVVKDFAAPVIEA